MKTYEIGLDAIAYKGNFEKSYFRSLVPSEAIETLFSNMLSLGEVQQKVMKNQISDDEAKNMIFSVCNQFHLNLYTYINKYSEYAIEIGNYAFDISFPYMMTSLLNIRGYVKPRGYAGDFETMEMVYENKPRGNGPIGKFIDEWVLGINSSQAVRNRWIYLTNQLEKEYENWNSNKIMKVANIACGSSREVFAFLKNKKEAKIKFVNLDIEKDAIMYGIQKAEKMGILDKIDFQKKDIIKMITSNDTSTLEKQNLIYANGLIDYFDDSLLIRFIDWVYENLEEKGMVIIGQIYKDNRDKPYIDYIMDWKMHYRNENDMQLIFKKSKFKNSKIDFSFEQNKVILFSSLRKNC